MSVNSKMTAIADAIRNLLDINEIMGLDAMANNISSITKRGAVAGTISEKSEQYIIPSGYHNGSGTVEISPDEQSKIIAENIKNGVTILGVAGSASGEIYSVIAVTYPEGSVCTCSNGTKTLTAKDTSGKALFNVTVGEWTVTATDGSSTKSASVSITTEGQIESVTLAYELHLIENGIANYPLNTMALTWKDTSGFGTNNPVFAQKAGYVLLKGKSGGYGAGYISGIDISGYTTLKIEFKSGTSTDGFTSGDRNKLAVWTDVGSYLGDNMVASLLLNADAVTNGAMLDISSLSGSHLIGLTTVYTYERRIKTLMLK